MDTHDIAWIRSILERDKRDDLANFLEGCKSTVIGSGQYGNFNNSILSTFIIYVPINKFLQIKKLTKEDNDIILNSILEVYPPEENSPEINSLKFRVLRDALVQQSIGKSIRVFLSYSTKDKVLIGVIKQYLEKFGLEVFIAHEDIKPSLKWQEVILENLDSTDIFIPVITENFTNSEWTDQESGVALAKSKFIIPVSIDGHTPYGFLNTLQALNFKIDKVDSSCNAIIETIAANPRFTKALIDSLINTLAYIGTFEEAKSKFRDLSGLDFSKEQINEIVKHSIQNNQIYESWGAQTLLNNLIRKYKPVIDKELLGQLSIKLKHIL